MAAFALKAFRFRKYTYCDNVLTAPKNFIGLIVIPKRSR